MYICIHICDKLIDIRIVSLIPLIGIYFRGFLNKKRETITLIVKFTNDTVQIESTAFNSSE